MARLVPSEFESITNSIDVHTPEARTLVRLHAELSDRFTVYHGVNWTRVKQSGSVPAALT